MRGIIASLVGGAKCAESDVGQEIIDICEFIVCGEDVADGQIVIRTVGVAFGLIAVTLQTTVFSNLRRDVRNLADDIDGVAFADQRDRIVVVDREDRRRGELDVA